MKRLLIFCGCLAMPALVCDGQETTWQGKTVQTWTAELADEDIRVRWYAAYALGQIGPEAAAAVEPLADVLRDDPHEYVRDGAAWALGRIGPAAEPAIEALGKTLRSNLPSIRRNSARALGRLGPAAKSLIPDLAEMLRDRDATVRVNAAAALWQIDRRSEAISALVQMTRGGEGPGAFEAVSVLGRLGLPPETAIPVLAEALRHASADVRRAAARSLGQVGPDAVAAIRPLLSDPDEEVRRGAVEAMGWIGPATVPEMIAALKNENPSVRRAAARALGRFGPAAREAEEALTGAFDDPDQRVRETAYRARLLVRGRPVGS